MSLEISTQKTAKYRTHAHTFKTDCVTPAEQLTEEALKRYDQQEADRQQNNCLNQAASSVSIIRIRLMDFGRDKAKLLLLERSLSSSQARHATLVARSRRSPAFLVE